MMPEISLHVLDLAQNCISAGASLVEVTADVQTADDVLTVIISDDGCGMTAEQLEKVTDPFFTSRKTRKVGLGIPFFKMAAELSGGNMKIESEPGRGTCIRAEFGLTDVDRMPLGDMNSTIHALIIMNAAVDVLYRFRVDEREFVLDTRKMREMLGEVPLDNPEVSEYIQGYLEENEKEVLQGRYI